MCSALQLHAQAPELRAALAAREAAAKEELAAMAARMERVCLGFQVVQVGRGEDVAH